MGHPVKWDIETRGSRRTDLLNKPAEQGFKQWYNAHMSLRFCYGPSGAGKSTYLQREMLRRSRELLDQGRLDENILFIVPEQYTMQTQKELVQNSPCGGILNIDVLSFGRLGHRIFEETGAEQRVRLDDIGKNLILRKVAAQHREELTVLKNSIGRPGMISEVKSVISEFMQYGVDPERVSLLILYAQKRHQNALAGRLKDIQLLYRGFLSYVQEKFITSEETMDLLAEAIPGSELIRRSILIFDGFTGFTPVQYRVLAELMRCSREVIVSLDFSEDGGDSLKTVEEQEYAGEEQSLFYLSRKTLNDLCRIAKQNGTKRGTDIVLTEPVYRYKNNAVLGHLERNLFRYPSVVFRKKQQAVRLIEADNIRQEVSRVFMTIRKMVRQEGMAYRDFAVVSGSLSDYAAELEKQALHYGVPLYVDCTRGILQNPLTELIRGLLMIRETSFGYEAVFHYLRSGLSSLTMEQTDLLENYCLAHGIRSRKKWQLPFEGEQQEEARKQFLREVEPVIEWKDRTAAGWCSCLQEFLQSICAAEQLESQAQAFALEGDVIREKEYSQVYEALIRLLEQTAGLLGEEEISVREYRELLEAGVAEIRLGTIPQLVDRVLAGDIERTRLGKIRTLFVIGVSDGSVPKGTARGGLISDPEREMLLENESGIELSPTPRQQIYIQRLYLYMNMTRPSERLILSYSKMSAEGKGVRPSYLIGTLQKMFPEIEVEHPDRDELSQEWISGEELKLRLAGGLRRLAEAEDGEGSRKYYENATEVLTLYGFLSATEDAVTADKLLEAAFRCCRPESIRPETARKLYGEKLRSSITRLETGAACFMHHFLQYGLALKEREEYRFEDRDAGTILHESIERFDELLRRNGLKWTQFTAEQGQQLALQALQEVSGAYHDLILYESERSAYEQKRLYRILKKTVDTLQYQLLKGRFEPRESELPFGERGEAEYPLEKGSLILRGRIDRIDLYEKDKEVFIKVLDYKSGYKDLKPEEIRKGLQLQLMVYMEAALHVMRRRFPDREITPAALLYYRFTDPVLTSLAVSPGGETDPAEPDRQLREEAQRESRRKLRPTGLVLENPDAVAAMDTRTDTAGAYKSDVIPVELKKDRTQSIFSSRSSTITPEEFLELQKTTAETIMRLGNRILQGDCTADPVKTGGGRTACTFCPYQNSCGFDRKIPGTVYREE